MRASKRQRKSKIHEDFVEIESGTDEDSEDVEIKRESPDDVDHVIIYDTTPSLQNSKKRTKPSIIHFSQEENLKMFEFILSKIRSSNPRREGRVAKRRIELSSSEFWEKCQQFVGGVKSWDSLKQYFKRSIPSLHAHTSLSLKDKADLYYSLHLRPDKSIRQKLIDSFEVQFDEQGYITGSLILHHWDTVHSDSESDETGIQKTSSSEYSGKFTEFDDGATWRVVVDVLNTETYWNFQSTKYWGELKKKYEGIRRKHEQTYRIRFTRYLLPNIHKMPFDTQAKAALYFHLEQIVPKEFRQELTDSVNIKMTKQGLITAYPDCPAPIVLQSKPSYDTVIGISSLNRYSTLKPDSSPYSSKKSREDSVPYTPEEDSLIWQYILLRSRNNKKNQRIRDFGMAFWRQMTETVKIQRSCTSLREHFTNELEESIMALPYDLKTKMELYFALGQTVEDDVLEEFQTIADVHLHEVHRTIRYIVGNDFLIGRKERSERHHQQNPYTEIQVGNSKSQARNTNILSRMDGVARQQQTLPVVKVPYYAPRYRPIKYKRDRREDDEERWSPTVDQMLHNNSILNFQQEEDSAPCSSSAPSKRLRPLSEDVKMEQPEDSESTEETHKRPEMTDKEQKPEHLLEEHLETSETKSTVLEAPPTLPRYSSQQYPEEAEPILEPRYQGRPARDSIPPPLTKSSMLFTMHASKKYIPIAPRPALYLQPPTVTPPQPNIYRNPPNPELDAAFVILESQLKTFSKRFAETSEDMPVEHRDIYEQRLEDLIRTFRNDTRAPPPY